MCGIAGAWGGRTRNTESIEQMAACLHSRGPDADGQWQDPEGNLALGHRRLAIVDLSPAGHQPMHSSCGRYVLVYNGEIYNHRALRADFEAEAVSANLVFAFRYPACRAFSGFSETAECLSTQCTSHD